VVKEMKKPGVYILRSVKNGRYYVGSTNDVCRRFDEHNSGKVSYTRNTRPWILMVFIQCENIKEAQSSEYKLKKYKRRDILEKVIGDKMFPWTFSTRTQNN